MTIVVAGARFLDFSAVVSGSFEPGNVLQRCTRNLRLANLSLVSSSAKSSSTHALSYIYQEMSCLLIVLPLLGCGTHNELDIGKTLAKLRILISDNAHTRDPSQRPSLSLFISVIESWRQAFLRCHKTLEENP